MGRWQVNEAAWAAREAATLEPPALTCGGLGANRCGLPEGSSLTLTAPRIEGSKQGQRLLLYQNVLTEKQPQLTLLVCTNLQKHTCCL